MREAFTSKSDDGEAGGGGAYSSHETQLLGDSVPVGQGEYLSDGLADKTGTTPTYRTHQAPPTPPRP